MRAVLKSGAATSLRVAAGPAPDPVDPRLAALADELVAAKAALAALEEKAAAAERRAVRDRAAAHDEGVEEGRRAAQDRADERVATLNEAAAAAAAAWRARLDDLEPLAATLARIALARLFGETDLGGQVAATVAHHLAALREAGATALHVHPALVAGLPETGLAVVADPSLATGGCRVALALGSADLSVERQWRAIDALLASLEAPR